MSPPYTTILLVTLLSLSTSSTPITVTAQSMPGMAPMTGSSSMPPMTGGSSMPPMTETMPPMTAVAAPGPSGGMSDVCLSALVNMSDCLSYVTPGSNLTVPDKPCCPELAGLVEGNPVCLCSLLAGNSSSSSSLGIDIDVKRALKLPNACKVKTPPVSMCSMIGVPVAGIPTAAPAMSPSGGASMGSEPTSSPNGASPAAAHHTTTDTLILAAALLHLVAAIPRT